MTTFLSEASDPFWWVFVLLFLGLAVRDYRRLRRLRAEKADLAVDGWVHSHADADGEWEQAYDSKSGAAKSGIGVYLILAMLPPVVWYVVPFVINWIHELQ
jgi:hypothetical protein